MALALPPGALTWQMAGVDTAWSTEAHLLATAVDTLNAANWQRAGGKGQQPKPIPRPSEAHELQAKRERALSRAAAFRARQQQQPPEPTGRPRDARGRFVKR